MLLREIPKEVHFKAKHSDLITRKITRGYQILLNAGQLPVKEFQQNANQRNNCTVARKNGEPESGRDKRNTPYTAVFDKSLTVRQAQLLADFSATKPD